MIPRPTRKIRWVWSNLAAGIGTAGIGTLLPIYVIQLGGTVLNVAFLSTLYNGVGLFLQLFWGFATDKLGRRRLFFMITNGGAAIAYLGMYLSKDIVDLTLAYGFLGVVVVANVASCSLLIIEGSPKESWAASFVALNIAGNTGGIIGLLGGTIWSSFLPLHDFFIVAFLSAMAALFFSLRFVSESPAPLETAQLFQSPVGIASRIYQGITERVQVSQLPHVTLSGPKRMVRLIRSGDTGRKYLFLSLFCFQLGGSTLSTSFIPYLLAYHVRGNEVFAISLASNTLQIFSYRWMQSNSSQVGGRSATMATVLRASAYAAICLSTFLLMGFNLFLFALIANGLSGMGLSLWNASASVMLVSSLGKERRGGIIGGYNSLSTIATMLGAVFSGIISFELGYAATFSVASALCAIALLILRVGLRWMPIHVGGVKV